MNPAGPPYKRRRTKDAGELWDDADDDFSAEALENIDNLIASSQAPCKPSPVPRLVGRGTHRSHSAGEMGRPLQLRESAAVGSVTRVVRHPIVQPSRFSVSDSEKQLREKCLTLSRQMKELQQSRDGQVAMLRTSIQEKERDITRLKQEMVTSAQTYSRKEESLEQKCTNLNTQMSFKDQELQDAHSRRLQLQRQLQQCQSKEPRATTSSPSKSNFPSTQSFMATESSPRKIKAITGVVACQTSPLKNTPQPKPKQRNRRLALRLKPSEHCPSLLQHLMHASSPGLQSLLGDPTVLQHSSNETLLSRLMPQIRGRLQNHLSSFQGDISALSLHEQDSTVLCALSALKTLMERSEGARQMLLSEDASFLQILRDLSFPKTGASLDALTVASVLAERSSVDRLHDFDCFLEFLPEAVLTDSTEASLVIAFLSLLSTLVQSDAIRSLICSANEECLLLSLALFIRTKEYGATDKTALSLAFIELLSALISASPSCLQSLSINCCHCATALIPSLIIIMHRELPASHNDASWAVMSRGFTLLHAQSLWHPHFEELHSLVEAKYVQLICGMELSFKARNITDEMTVNALHELWDFEPDVASEEEEAEHKPMQQ